MFNTKSQSQKNSSEKVISKLYNNRKRLTSKTSTSRNKDRIDYNEDNYNLQFRFQNAGNDYPESMHLFIYNTTRNYCCIDDLGISCIKSGEIFRLKITTKEKKFVDTLKKHVFYDSRFRETRIHASNSPSYSMSLKMDKNYIECREYLIKLIEFKELIFQGMSKNFCSEICKTIEDGIKPIGQLIADTCRNSHQIDKKSTGKLSMCASVFGLFMKDAENTTDKKLPPELGNIVKQYFIPHL